MGAGASTDNPLGDINTLPAKVPTKHAPTAATTYFATTHLLPPLDATITTTTITAAFRSVRTRESNSQGRRGLMPNGTSSPRMAT